MSDKGITQPLEFSEAFAFEIALQFHPPEEVCKEHGVSAELFERLKKTPLFREAIAKYVRQIKEKGISLQLKSAITTEMLLPVVYKMAKDEEMPGPTRQWAIDRIAKWADLDKPSENSDVPVFQLFIGTESPPRQVDAETAVIPEMIPVEDAH